MPKDKCSDHFGCSFPLFNAICLKKNKTEAICGRIKLKKETDNFSANDSKVILWVATCES